MGFLKTFSVPIALLASSVLADPVNLPVVDGGIGINYTDINNGLLANLPAAGSKVTPWPGYIPQYCQDEVTGNNFSVSDIDVFNVTYDDCTEPWTFCRHHDAQTDQATMIDLFGRLTVKTRGFIANMIALPADAMSAYTVADHVVIFGGEAVISLFVHETGHSLDGHHYNSGEASPPEPWSNGTDWVNAVQADGYVDSPYADTSYQEDCAQETNMALFDTNVPGGLPSIDQNATLIQNQYTTLEKAAGDVLVPGGKCENRVPLSPAIPISNMTQISRIMGTPPSSAFGDGSIKIIPAAPDSDEVLITHFRESGQPHKLRKVTFARDNAASPKYIVSDQTLYES